MSDLLQPEEDDTPEPRRGVVSSVVSSIRRLAFLLVALFLLYNILMHGNNGGLPFGKQPSEFGRPAEPKPAPAAPQAAPAPQPAPEPPPEERHAAPGPAANPEPMPEASPPEVPAPQPAAEPEKHRLAELEHRFAEQEARLAAVTAQMEQLLQSRGQLENAMGMQQQRLASITLMGQLRQSLDRGESFRGIVEELRGLNGDHPKIGRLLVQLSGASSSGVLPLPALQQQFRPLLEDILQQQAGSGFSANLKKLVRIRKVGERQAGMDDESILARAEAQLAQGRLADTLKTLDALSQQGKTVLAPWLKSARDHLNAHEAADEIQRLLIQPAPEPEEAKPAPEEKPARVDEKKPATPEAPEVE